MEYKDQFLGLHYFVTKIIRILRHPESSSHLNSGRFPRLSAFSINQIFWGSFHLKLSFWLLCNRKFHDVLGNYKSNLSSPSLRGLHQHNIANKEKNGFCLLTMTNATNISQSLKKKKHFADNRMSFCLWYQTHRTLLIRLACSLAIFVQMAFLG